MNFKNVFKNILFEVFLVKVIFLKMCLGESIRRILQMIFFKSTF